MRHIAFEVLCDVAERDAYANLALPARLRGLSSRDAAFVTELVAGTLRMQGKYDAIIDAVARRGVSDPRTRIVLRLGVHQLLSMRTPNHAAISETVNLQRRYVSPRTTGFVNGVLRTVSRTDNWDEVLRQQAKTPDAALATLHSHPEWIVRALRTALAAEGAAAELEDLLAADNRAPKVNLALLGSEDLEQDLIASLAPEISPEGLSPIGWVLEGGSPEAVSDQLEGFCYPRVQDQGSQLAALALVAARPLEPGEQWLDLCAGPGGKTAVLAEAAQSADIALRANEVTPHRADLVRQAVPEDRHDVDVVCFDGRDEAAFAREDGNSYDRILVDAPCTGLGALRRRPEARWRKTPEDIPELTALQFELLSAAVEHLKPGGLVAYVTCSPHLAETVGVVSRVAKRDDVEILDTVSVLNGVTREPLESGAGPHVQLWPHRHGTDAMFISLLQRV